MILLTLKLHKLKLQTENENHQFLKNAYVIKLQWKDLQMDCKLHSSHHTSAMSDQQ